MFITVTDTTVVFLRECEDIQVGAWKVDGFVKLCLSCSSIVFNQRVTFSALIHNSKHRKHKERAKDNDSLLFSASSVQLLNQMT